MRYFDRLWILSAVDAVATLTWGSQCQPEHLREAYLASLKKLQPWTSIRYGAGEPIITFENLGAIADYIRRDAWLPIDLELGKHLVPSGKRELVRMLIKQGQQLISRTNSDLRQLIDLTIAELFVAHKAGYGGGTMSSAVGLIWLNPQTDWDARVTGENIVHEWIHNMLFLADMVTPVFAVDYTALSDESSGITSAILHRRRPFDRAYHSAAVAAGLVLFRLLRGDDQRAIDLVPPALKTVGELRGMRHLLTQDGLDMLEEIEAFLRTRDCSHVLDLLGGTVRRDAEAAV